MKPIVVLYATREGQTRRIAEHVADALRAFTPVELVNAAEIAEPFPLGRYAAAVLAASVHIGRHERELVTFVKRHRDALTELPCAFLSVSLSEATVEDPQRPPAARAQATSDVQRMLEDFFRATGWRPRMVLPVAGALLYTRYNLLIRWVMKMIARRAGGSTDTTRDHEFTNWQALDRFAGEFAREVIRPGPPASPDGRPAEGR